MIKANINQPNVYSGNSASTQYVNKVTLSADGTIKVVATPVVKPTLLAPTTTVTTKTTTVNQITTNATTAPSKPITIPGVTKTDPQGITVSPTPPGAGGTPPPPAKGNVYAN